MFDHLVWLSDKLTIVVCVTHIGSVIFMLQAAIHYEMSEGQRGQRSGGQPALASVAKILAGGPKGKDCWAETL